MSELSWLFCFCRLAGSGGHTEQEKAEAKARWIKSQEHQYASNDPSGAPMRPDEFFVVSLFCVVLTDLFVRCISPVDFSSSRRHAVSTLMFLLASNPAEDCLVLARTPQRAGDARFPSKRSFSDGGGDEA